MLPSLFIYPMEALLHILINSYSSESYCICILSEEPYEFKISNSFIYINPKNSKDLVSILKDVADKGCSDYIIQMREPERFMYAFDIANYLGNVRRSDKKLIFLPFSHNLKNAMEILSMHETKFVANVLLILPNIKNGECLIFDLVTHKFVGPDSEVNRPVYLDRWDSCTEKFDKNVNLFPHDMRNMYGKTLKLSCFTYKPYSLLDLDQSIEPSGRDGLEIRIIDEFCRWVNCTVEIIREDDDQWGEIYDNRTGIGVLGSVVEDRGDMGISALYSWYEMWKVLDFSTVIVRTGITCLAPSPRIIASWEMPFMPFTWLMWVAVIVTLFYASIGMVIAQRCSTNKALLFIFGIMISQSQYNVGASWRIRSVIGWLLITVLILGSAYGAGLASTFTIPKYEPSIDTVKDIVDSGIEWGATHDAWIFSLTLSTEPQVKQLVKQFRIYSFKKLKQKTFTRTMAFSIEKLPAGHFAIGEYISKDAILNMQLMLEDFYYEQCVVMLRKSSPYTKKLSELIGRLHQSGLLLAWETQVVLKHLDYKVQLEVKLSRSKNDNGYNTKALTLKHVGGIFILYFTGVFISIMLFLAEMFHRRIIAGSYIGDL